LPEEIVLRLFGPLSGLAGEKTVRLAPARRTVAGLLEELVRERPAVSGELLDERGSVSYRFTVVVNREIIDRSRWEDVILSEGDEVALMSIVAGG